MLFNSSSKRISTLARSNWSYGGPIRVPPFPLAHWFSSSTTANESTTWTPEMSRLYLNFFYQGEPAWHTTKECASRVFPNGGPRTVLDVASGPGEPSGTMKETFPDAKVWCTDSAQGMLDLARNRLVDEKKLEDIQFLTLEMNNIDEDLPSGQTFDLVTANFALMFTPDLEDCLRQIHKRLDSSEHSGYLIGTVWNHFELLPALGGVMEQLLGEKPPPAPINPLSLKDKEVLDGALTSSKFSLLHDLGHNVSHPIDVLMSMDDPDTLKTILIPVTPKIAELQEDAAEGENVMDRAMGITDKVLREMGFVDADGQLKLSGEFRQVVAQRAS